MYSIMVPAKFRIINRELEEKNLIKCNLFPIVILSWNFYPNLPPPTASFWTDEFSSLYSGRTNGCILNGDKDDEVLPGDKETSILSLGYR